MLNFDVATSDCSSSSSGEAFAKPSSEAGAAASIEIFPAEAVKRQASRWYGMAAETVECAGQRGAEFRFSGPMHLLAISDRKLSFLPAGHAYHEWHRLSAHGRFVFVYFDPAKLQALDLKTPHLFIEDRMLVETALRLAVVVERASPRTNPISRHLAVFWCMSFGVSAVVTRRAASRFAVGLPAGNSVWSRPISRTILTSTFLCRPWPAWRG